ncbi:hypothetical protein HanIR_Chr10g0501491 [Helianthus annuus]|nr:hypothetical protein HanIR_Chr10g0501491 [Helianthus annuus]
MEKGGCCCTTQFQPIKDFELQMQFLTPILSGYLSPTANCLLLIFIYLLLRPSGMGAGLGLARPGASPPHRPPRPVL